MISLDKLVQIGFTLPTATDISAFFQNVGYLANITDSDVVDGFDIPADNHL